MAYKPKITISSTFTEEYEKFGNPESTCHENDNVGCIWFLKGKYRELHKSLKTDATFNANLAGVTLETQWNNDQQDGHSH